MSLSYSIEWYLCDSITVPDLHIQFYLSMTIHFTGSFKWLKIFWKKEVVYNFGWKILMQFSLLHYGSQQFWTGLKWAVVCVFTRYIQNNAMCKILTSMLGIAWQEQDLTVLDTITFSGEFGVTQSSSKSLLLTHQRQKQTEAWEVIWLYLHHSS